MIDNSSSIAKVAVPVPYSAPYDYQVPPELRDSIQPGVRVLVPLGRREVIGTVVELQNESPVTNLKPLRDLLDYTPIFDERLLSLSRWIADYYLCSWGEVLESALPRGIKPKLQRSLKINTSHPEWQNLFPDDQEWLLNFENKGEALLTSGKEKTRLNQFKKKGLIELKTQVTNHHSGKEKEEWIELTKEDSEKGNPRKGSKGDLILELLKQDGSIAINTLKKRFKNVLPVIRSLEEKALVSRIIKDAPKESPSSEVRHEKFIQLNREQETVFGQIRQSIQEDRYVTFLLFGVTGSGKTEVYLYAVKEALALGKTALVLIPEISLTPQAVSRFSERFGERIAVLHSGMSEKERSREWWKIKNRQSDIVIGARSAIFAPLENIGLIVVDEEHDSSYKQQETPYYNARDLAVKMGSDLGAAVILGSATPSIESNYNAKSGKYQLLELTQRANLKPLPEAKIINLKESKRQQGAFYLSKELMGYLRDNLDRNKQSLIFLNRRGFASFLSCKECELPVLCENCSIAMTWHKSKKQLVCHHCGYGQRYPKVCPSCGHDGFRMEGFGTQRVEQDLGRLFSEAAFLRMDRDTIQKKGALEKNINLINDQKVDIVIGTQLISKGHDFKHIGMVCIVLADMSLNFPDFRSSERSFQLISQVSGRAGRDETGEGLTLVQAYNPDHFAIKTAMENDYLSFYQKEIEVREILQNPPFVRMILIKISNTNYESARTSASHLAELLTQHQKDYAFEVMGPVEAPIQKVNRRYYWQILLKGESLGSLKRFLKIILWERKVWRPMGATRVTVDVDPYMML